ncbi:3-keto-disaccharide hydrolase [Fibrella aquatica]|uniref:3-keto-disaccharide hydrolase n=1 Tax=Fibrella aquatica TaxID=3242487 RepID=UPI00351FCDE2
MRQSIITIGLLFITNLCVAQKVRDKDWVQLFNGKDLSNWNLKITGHPLNDNYGNTFRVANGNMVVNYDQYKAFDEQYGHIFTKQKYSAYLLVVEYRFVGNQVKGGPGWATRNSGAMLHAQAPETMGLQQDFPISLETQFLGGDGQRERHTANLCTPGTNVVLDGKLFTPHCIDSKSKTYAGEQWVRAEMLVLGDSLVQHIMEGDTVLSYTKPQIGGGNVSHADPAVKVDGKPLREGYIALQSESHPVEFRKVALFNLAPYMNKPKQLASVLNQLKTRK